MAQFWDYEVRKTRIADLGLAIEWTQALLKESFRGALQAAFWLEQDPPNVESFLVFHHDPKKYLTTPIAFFKVKHVGELGDQARLHFQAGPGVSPKLILRGVSKLVPIIEKALAQRGVKAIFFTSHSESMAVFMADHFGYHYAGDGKVDGVIMAKGIR